MLNLCKFMGSDPINFFLRWRSGTQDGYADMKKAPMAFISHGRYSSYFIQLSRDPYWRSVHAELLCPVGLAVLYGCADSDGCEIRL